MTRTYTFSECYALLDVDPKTFRRWLEKAGIDPEHQVSKVDNRIRFLTQEQVDLLARDHGRDLRAPETRHAEIIPASAYKLLVDRVEDLERQEKRFLSWIERHEERLDAAGDAINEHTEHSATLRGITADLISAHTRAETQISDLHAQSDQAAQNIHAMQNAITGLLEQNTALVQQLDQAQAMIAELQRPARAKKPKPALAGEGAALPEGSLPARTFAELHNQTRDRMEGWIAAGQIPATPIPYGRRIQHQLTPGQQQAAITWWNAEHIPYDRCPDCPHGTDQGRDAEELAPDDRT